MSRPVWGAWIEILSVTTAVMALAGRAPYGARGLKFITPQQKTIVDRSRPVWGAWIEILCQMILQKTLMSRPVWGAWIEITKCLRTLTQSESRPVWGAWIEIFELPHIILVVGVAPRMGRVD